MIRRHGISGILDDGHDLLSLPGGSYTSSGSVRETSQSGSSGKRVETLCLGLLDLFATKGRSFASSSELTLTYQKFSILAQLKLVPPRHCVCVGRFTREAFFERLKPL